MGAELSEGDWAEYQRLCLAESLEFIPDLPDYYAFFTYSMFPYSLPVNLSLIERFCLQVHVQD